jgi:hypothetical protein
MWWIFGLINMIIVMAFAWFYHKKIKEEATWVRYEKVAFGTLLVFAFLSGILGTILMVGGLIYLVIDFVKFIRK